MGHVVIAFDFEKFLASEVNSNILHCSIFCNLLDLFKHTVVYSQSSDCP